MAPMKSSRRIFALVAAFAVAFGALWPLVSAARPGPPPMPNLICTQGGFQHAPAAPADHDEKSHCPLCVVSMDSALPVIPAGAAAALAPSMCAIPTPRRSLHALLLARPPPARAPPAFS
ncbi:MAG: DUF2946 family protein [Usitatibacter sp.]